jgi:hypothetical protein
MKKIQAAVLVLLAAMAFCAVTASAAFAENEWLANGNPIAVELSAETSGSPSIYVSVLGVVVTELHCGTIFDGTVGAGSFGLVTKILNVAKEEISSVPLAGLALACKIETSLFETCGKVGETAEVWLGGLPWLTEISLSGAEFKNKYPSTFSYEIHCVNGNETQCTIGQTATLTNETGGVAGVIGGSPVTCNTGAGNLKIENMLTTLVAAETLSVS